MRQITARLHHQGESDFAHPGREPDGAPRPSASISWSLSAEMHPPTPGRPILTVPIAFSAGQRYQGTSVSHSIRDERPILKPTSLTPVTTARLPTPPPIHAFLLNSLHVI